MADATCPKRSEVQGRLLLAQSAGRSDGALEGRKRLLDVDPHHPKGTSRFRQAFSSGRVGPGDHEIYRPRPEGYTPASLRERMPFRVPELALFDVDLSQATLVFYVRDDKEWLTDDALGLKVTDTIEVDRFSFEQ